jgi:DNA-binding XRE family transcriptional regulator
LSRAEYERRLREIKEAQEYRITELEAKQAVIYRLNALGWTQEEIGKTIGLTQQAISLKYTRFRKLAKTCKFSPRPWGLCLRCS